jgi:hypothetical protein
MDGWLVREAREAREYQQADRMRDSQREERRGVNDGCRSIPGRTSTDMNAIYMSIFQSW